MTLTSLPESSTSCTIEVVLGVDTHRDTHSAAVVSALGALLGTRTFPATAAGYRAMLGWVRRYGLMKRAGVECTGSYGAALSRTLQDEGVEVFDVNQPDKRARRTRGKTDTIDAEAAARAVVSGRAKVIAKTGDGLVESMRLLKLARDSAVGARTKAINQLKAVIVGADPQLRESLTGLGPATLIRRCADLVEPDNATAVEQTVIYTLRLLAERIMRLKAEAYELHKRLKALISQHNPGLLTLPGVGPDSAAALLIAAGDNPERLRHEASFAALCGVSPVEASSGNTHRRRLNRGGDRQANAALFPIVISRLRHDQRTSNYLQRRTAEGKTKREVVRCLKRYIAREIFNLIRPAREPQGVVPAA